MAGKCRSAAFLRPAALSLLFNFAGLIAASASGDGGHHWEYGEGDKGPQLWPMIEPRCNGTHQSPIRLQKAVYNASLRHVHFEGYHDGEGFNFTLLNDGHSAKLKLPRLFYLYGGDLKGRYVADSLHFHWGKTDNHGSEHTFRGKRFPVEMHIVHYHEMYKDLKEIEANGTSDSLAVTGFLFELSEEDNVHLEGVVQALHHIQQPDQERVIRGFPLDHLMPAHHHYYYRYEGSLTVPSCVERVLWTVFADRIPISARQLSQFRKLKDNRGRGLSGNFRPEQPLNERQLYTNVHDESYSFSNDFASRGSSASSNAFLSTAVTILLLIAKQ